MLGTGIGELKVLLRDSAGTNTSTVWQKSGQQGLNWIQASVEVQRDSEYKVIYIALFVHTAISIKVVGSDSSLRDKTEG